MYGDSAQTAGGWVNVDRIIAEIRDAATLEPDARRFVLNEVVAGALLLIDPIRCDAAAAPREQLKRARADRGRLRRQQDRGRHQPGRLPAVRWSAVPRADLGAPAQRAPRLACPWR